jgi:hypothetical protein
VETRIVNVKFLARVQMNVWGDGNVASVNPAHANQVANVVKMDLAARPSLNVPAQIVNAQTRNAAKVEPARYK